MSVEPGAARCQASARREGPKSLYRVDSTSHSADSPIGQAGDAGSYAGVVVYFLVANVYAGQTRTAAGSGMERRTWISRRNGQWCMRKERRWRRIWQG